MSICKHILVVTRDQTKFQMLCKAMKGTNVSFNQITNEDQLRGFRGNMVIFLPDCTDFIKSRQLEWWRNYFDRASVATLVISE